MSDKARKDVKAMAGIQEGAARSMLSKDATSSRLLNAGKALGNAEMQRKIDGRNAKRDELLAFLCKRLGAMRQVQQREVDKATTQALAKDRTKLNDGGNKENFASNPLKWRGPANLYEQAAYQLCQGNLHRGAQLVDQAIQAERQCFEQVSGHVDLDGIDTGIGVEQGSAAEGTRPGETCGERATPEGVDLADEIDRCETVARDVANRFRVRDPDREEDEEEDENNQGKGQSAPGEQKK